MTSTMPLREDDRELLDGRYRLDGVLGEGGYARVHRAHDEVLGRPVAIKFFTAGSTDVDDHRRRDSETRLLASLAHASLVTLYDAQLDATPGYLVMELIDGPTLRELIEDGPLTPADTARLAVELGEALRVIHAAGIVHRDIKPANVLMRPPQFTGGAPHATLADFGIAALVDSTRLTATGRLVGTAAYLSPEQARGERATAPTDVYALGLVLLEALTGRRVFAQHTPQEALAARLTRSPEIPSDLPADWRNLLSAMTALDPAHRPDAAGVVRAAERLRTPGGTGPATVPLSPVLPPSPAGSPASTVPLAATLPFAPEPTAVDAPARPPAAVAPASPPAGARKRRMPRWAFWGLQPLVVVGLVLAGYLIVQSLSAAAPPGPPPFPELTEPLGTHFDDLWNELTP